MDIQDNYSVADKSISNRSIANRPIPSHQQSSAHNASFSRKFFSVKSNAFSYKRINGHLSCSVNFSSNQVETRFIAEQAATLLDKLLKRSLQHKKHPSQIECYLYSPENQVHVLSFGLGSDSAYSSGQINHQNDRLVELVKTRIRQLKLVFSINRIELNCDQSEILAQAV